jgi:peptide/nickel transport system permease protein
VQIMTPPAAADPPARFAGNRLLAAGLLITGLLVLVAALAPYLAPHPPDLQYPDGLDPNGTPLPPGGRFLLGTDNLGRDVLSRTLFGARISLTVGIVAMLTATVIGVLTGLAAAYYGGWVDTLLMRLTDVMMSIPALLLAIAFAALMTGRRVHLHPAWIHAHFLDFTLRRGLVSIFLVIGIVSWTSIARVVRAQALTVRERDFVAAARALGASHRRILWRHIFPNVVPAILVLATMSTAGTILLEAGLSYLGMGVPPPASSWGSMISDGQPYLIAAPWIVLPPGIAVILAVVGFNLLGQGLQDVLDPFHRRHL